MVVSTTSWVHEVLVFFKRQLHTQHIFNVICASLMTSHYASHYISWALFYTINSSASDQIFNRLYTKKIKLAHLDQSTQCLCQVTYRYKL